MNIVLFVNSFLPRIGGREIVVHYLAREYQRMGHAVRIVGPSGFLSRMQSKTPYPVHRWPTLRGLFKDQVAYIQLRLDVAFWGCDIIHAHTTYPNGYAAAQLKRVRHFPLVITPHGADIHMIPELSFGHRLDPAKRKKINIALQSAEIVTAISTSIKSSLIDAGCEPSDIRSIPNGIDIERFENRGLQNVRKCLNFADDARLILTVGNYHPRKGQDIIIKAMPRILTQIPEARLLVVGGNQQALDFLVRKLGLEREVRLTGSIPFPLSALYGRKHDRNGNKDYLAAMYSQSDIYVSAGINKEAEGLSLALLDAMAAGLPVVATRISGNSDAVIDGQTGILVQPDNETALAQAVIALLDQKTKAAMMGRLSKNWAFQYNWSNIAQRYISIYREAISIPKRLN